MNSMFFNFPDTGIYCLSEPSDSLEGKLLYIAAYSLELQSKQLDDWLLTDIVEKRGKVPRYRMVKADKLNASDDVILISNRYQGFNAHRGCFYVVKEDHPYWCVCRIYGKPDEIPIAFEKDDIRLLVKIEE